jgi:hypothetical protein
MNYIENAATAAASQRIRAWFRERVTAYLEKREACPKSEENFGQTVCAQVSPAAEAETCEAA